MSAVDDLLAFVRAQLDEDERVAREITAPEWSEGCSWLSDLRDPLPSQRRAYGLGGRRNAGNHVPCPAVRRTAGLARGVGGVRCWLCGVEPLQEIDTSALGSTFTTSLPGRWPPALDGHAHAERPPTPGELEQAGHEALRVILEQA